MLIEGYQKGSDITILNTIYNKPKKIDDKKWDKGYITIIFRDNITKQKHHCIIENPDYEFYFLKDGETVDTHELFLEKDKLKKISTPFVDLEKTIAELTDNTNFYYDNIKSGNRSANKQLHTHAKVFNSDMNIEDHYRLRFSEEYKNDTFQITKSYFDIEVDTINMRGDFPELGECPINAVTIIFEAQNKTYTLLLREPKNKLIEEFEKSISPNMFNELKEFIKTEVGGYKNEIRYKLDKMQYEMIFYDEEIQLIQDLFKLVNLYQPDFLLAWNMAFDIPYVIERVKALGYDPAEILCHPDFEIKNCYYVLDEMHKDLAENKCDYYVLSSYTVLLDQLVQFASRRKNRNRLDDNKLDTVGEAICNVRKLDYSHITTKIAELPWKDYHTFVFYNIMDTIVQKCIENKVNDIDYTFNKCLINNTRYCKCHRHTVYIINRATIEFKKDDFIICNNKNRHNQKESFPGAFVADALRISPKPRQKIGNNPIDIYNNSDDFDYKSLYPSEIREFNMAPNTQIGKIKIDEQVYKNENPYKSNIYDRGGQFLEDLQSRNYFIFCSRWFNLANYRDLYDDVLFYFQNKYTPCFPLFTFNEHGFIMPIQRTVEQINVIHKSKNNELFYPIDRYSKMPDGTDILNINVNEVVSYDNKGI